MAKEQKLYILRKYIYASSAIEAIKKDKKTPVEDCWIDDVWKQNNMEQVEQKKQMGFKKINVP